MKARELMIGDWVHIAPSVPGRKEYDTKVCGVGEEVILIRKKSGIDSINYDRVEPVLLTRDLLELNGWERNHLGVWYSKGYIDVIPATNATEYTSIDHPVVNIQPCGELCLLLRRCDYVHEFQHMLRVAGLPDEADNFKVTEG